jgi:hypothetical protein
VTTRRRDDERGSIAPAVPIIAMALLLLGGLGIDGSRQLNARGEAVAFAEEAARAGAQAIDPASDKLALDQALAEERVHEYCAEVLKRGQVTECGWDGIHPVSEDDPRMLVVRVKVRLSVPASLLSIVGVQDLRASATGSARPYEGVTAADS